MSHDEIELAFFEEHGHNPDAQELHDFVNQMVGPGKPASPEEVDKLLAESERARTLERLADEDPDVRQSLAELQKQNTDRSRGELLKDMDIVGRMMANHPGLTREQALKMIEDLGF